MPRSESPTWIVGLGSVYYHNRGPGVAVKAQVASLTSRIIEPYGLEQDGRGPAMVDFRGHNHVAVALAYTELKSMAYHPTDGITMEFREHKVIIRGRNLRELYDLLVDQRITYIQEDDFDNEPETATFVDAIIVARAQEAV